MLLSPSHCGDILVTRQVGQRDVSPRGSQVDRLLGASSPLPKRSVDSKSQAEREPRFPPLRQQFQQQERSGKPPPHTVSPTHRRMVESLDSHAAVTRAGAPDHTQNQGPSSSGRASGRPPLPRDDSRGRQDYSRTPASPREAQAGRHGTQYKRSGPEGADASQSEEGRVASGHDPENRLETRSKGRGRTHRRGGRGRPRKEKATIPQDYTESEQ
ncbi:hypothetical protein E2C01_001206 [Portunus trituberculatus]|uniref:Uncharacterized protein n=1 Tax=Portunus trituberculatus TaxID=210409 RepID=A0A5B7CGL8_PORTR|nr:hypothetical protein [Portunus trituberculatus]